MSRRARVSDCLQTLTVQMAVGMDYGLLGRKAERCPGDCSHVVVGSRAVSAWRVWQVTFSPRLLIRRCRVVLICCISLSCCVRFIPCSPFLSISKSTFNGWRKEVVSLNQAGIHFLPPPHLRPNKTSTSHFHNTSHTLLTHTLSLS